MERPILYSSPMVKAILDGRKTMTRQVVNTKKEMTLDLCPYGRIGSKLWVKESFNVVYFGGYHNCDDGMRESYETFAIKYKATPGVITEINVENKDHPHYEKLSILSGSGPEDFKFRSLLFMPRWASRIDLEITNVKIERLQDISEEDAKKEGIFNCESESSPLYTWCEKDGLYSATAKNAFRYLWDNINAKKGKGWDTNPWVWVIELKRI